MRQIFALIKCQDGDGTWKYSMISHPNIENYKQNMKETKAYGNNYQLYDLDSF